MAGEPVDLKFRADLSQLVQEMKSLPGMTEAEAKKMAGSLERQLKKAEKASTKAAKASQRAWKSQKAAMASAGKSADALSGKLRKVEHAGGETSSVMGGVASAIDTVSPSAGGAARTLGDVAGGVEMVARSGSGLAGPLAVLTIAVVAGTKAWEAYNRKQKETQLELDNTRAKRIALAEVMLSFDEQIAVSKKELDLVEGRISQREFDRWSAKQSMLKKTIKTGQDINGQAKEDISLKQHLIDLDQKAKAAATALAKAEATEADARAKKNRNSVASVVAYSEANKATHDARHAAKRARLEYDQLSNSIDKNARVTADIKARRRASLQALKASTKGGRKAVSVLKQLNDETERLLPKQDLDKVQELSNHLEKLEAAASGSKKASNALAAAIVETGEAIAALKAERAAEEFEKLIAAYDALAPAPTLSRMAQLEAAQREINDAIAAGEDTSGRLAAKLKDVNKAIREESAKTKKALQADTDAIAKKAAEDAAAQQDAYLAAFSNIIAASAMISGEMLARTESAAQDEIEAAQDVADSRQAMLEDERENRAKLLEESAERDVSRELAVSEARIAQLTAASEAERAALHQTKTEQGAAVRDAFNLNKALKLSEITMSTASAIVSALTVPPPAGVVLAGTVAARGATQAGIVAAQEPPSFHLGGIVGSRPDERQITARAGEGVLTRQGVQAIGGEAGLAAANRGQGGGPMVVQMVYRHKVLDEVLSDSVRRGGPIGGAINRRSPRGRTNPHGRR